MFRFKGVRIIEGYLLIVLLFVTLLFSKIAAAAVYYVSSTSGDDANDGLSPTSAFATVAHVNSLALLPGDEVRFACGERWRTDPLVIVRSGVQNLPIVFTSNPPGCGNKPLLSGAQPVTDWVVDDANVYRADLSSGTNAGRFTLGINQLFRNASRLPMGRWPNIAGHPDGGYAEVDAQPTPDSIQDTALPALDWTGAVMHIKGMRWYMLNRKVTASAGSALTLNADVQCWDDCSQWGYFLNSHRATLDTEGEWYYDVQTNQVYLYSKQGLPADNTIEASVVIPGEGAYLGGVILGRHLNEHIAYVTLDNFAIERWFDAGITTPLNLRQDENHHLVLRNNRVRDVDGTGVRLATWVWDAANNGNGPNGWRGGRDMTVENNIIERVNNIGIDSYMRDSTLRDNQIIDTARIENLGRAGMGCGYEGTNCTENGAGIRLKLDQADYTANNNQILRNRLSRIGMNGIDIFGAENLIENNVIDSACYSKGDCGAIRSFGSQNLIDTPVFNLSIRGNILRNTIGNTDGTHPDYESLFGFGIYIDHYSNNITVSGNTVTESSYSGILFQHSTGTVQDNILYDNVNRNDWGAQIALAGNVTRASLNGNVMFALSANRRTLSVSQPINVLTSDNNYFFNPFADENIHVQEPSGMVLDLDQWRALSGLDSLSSAHWYTLAEGGVTISRLFVNETESLMALDMTGSPFVDMDQQPVGNSLNLAVFSSEVLLGEYAGCSGDVVFLPNVTFPAGVTDCIANVSLTTGGSTVQVPPGAELRIDSPAIWLLPDFRVLSGGSLRVYDP